VSDRHSPEDADGVTHGFGSLSSIVQPLYNATVRPFLPRKLAVLNGVVARQPKLFDATDRDPEYEVACIKSLRTHVQDGDDVLVIGGGAGVSAVAAAQSADNVEVTVFEAATEQTEVVEETLALNQVQSTVSVRHAVVGDAVRTWGDTSGAETIAPYRLPEADVIEIDAEGAEISILSQLNQRPRVLIVESHGHLDAPTQQVRDLLCHLGYSIESIEAEDADRDVMVLTGVIRP